MNEEALYEGRPQCEHPDCPWCARNFFSWVKARMAQMATPRREKRDPKTGKVLRIAETTSFAEAAATSIIPRDGQSG